MKCGLYIYSLSIVKQLLRPQIFFKNFIGAAIELSNITHVHVSCIWEKNLVGPMSEPSSPLPTYVLLQTKETTVFSKYSSNFLFSLFPPSQM